MPWTKFLFSVNGRISRTSFWLKFTLPLIVISVVLVIIDIAIGTFDKEAGIGLLTALLVLIIFWPTLAVSVKRLHDGDKSGWLYPIAFIPIIGPIWYFIYVGILKGTTGTNRFGPDPLEHQPETSSTTKLAVIEICALLAALFAAILYFWFSKPSLEDYEKRVAVPERSDYATPELEGFDKGWATYMRGDYAKAHEELLAVAEQGDFGAQHAIGIMYYKGQGVPQDNVQAYMWLNLAAVKAEALVTGYDDARKARDLVAKEMTPADISTAQRLVREWLEEHGE